MIEELPKAMSQEQISHEIGPIKIKPISMIIPPREKSKRTLYKRGKPVREEAGGAEGIAEQMAEEPSIKPMSETHKWHEAEQVYEAVWRAWDIRQEATYKRKEKVVDPECRNSKKTPERWKQEEKEKKQPKHKRGWKP